MIDREGEFSVRRILVALDAAGEAPELIEAAAEMAGRLHAELLGLFVEDVNLLRSAALPFVRRMSPGSPTWKEFDTATMERELHAVATRARRTLERAAERRHVTYSFQVVRGQVTREVAGASEQADLVVLGGAYRLMGALQQASGARAAMREARRSVLLMRPGAAPARNFVVGYDRARGSDRAVLAAQRLVQATEGTLTVLLFADSAEEGRALESRVRTLLGPQGGVLFRRVAHPSLAGLCRLAQEVEGAVLVLSADNPLAQGEAAEELMDRIRCPLLVVR